MAIVRGFNRETIRAFNGTVDFYYWKGIPVARAWPDWSNFKPSENQALSMAAYTEANAQIKKISGRLRAYYRALTAGQKSSWLDVVRGSFMRTWKQYRVYPPVLLDAEMTDEGDSWKVITSWSHSSDIRAAIIADVYDDEKQNIEKKGIPAECTAPPYGPLVLDPDVPPDEPPKPLLIPGTLIHWDEVELVTSMASNSGFRFGSGIPGPPAGACMNAWNRCLGARWTGASGVRLVEEGAQGYPYGAGDMKVTVRQRRNNLSINMNSWRALHPDDWPDGGELWLTNWRTPAAGHVTWLPAFQLRPIGAGVTKISFSFPEAWKSGGTKTAMLTPEAPPTFCPGGPGDHPGFWIPGYDEPPRCIVYPKQEGVVYEHIIPKEVIPPKPKRPREWYRWEIQTDVWGECAQVPGPIQRIS